MKKTPRRQGPVRRTTFDLEAGIHKRLQFAALEESERQGQIIHMVDVAEHAIRCMLDTMDDPSHDAAYHFAFEAGRRAAFAEAQEAVGALGEDAPPAVVVTPVEPAPVRLLPTRPPTIHTKGQS